MAIQVPTYDRTRELPSGPNQLPSVRQTAAPTADMLGANQRLQPDRIGAGLDSFAKDTEAVFQKMQDRDDADLILRAEVARDNALRERNADWLSRKGVNAWNLTKEVNDWWDKNAASFAEGLNDRQRRVYEQRTLQRREASLDSVSRYEVQQRIQSQSESQQAAIGNQINRAIDGIGNDAEQAAARGEIDKLVTMQSRLLGWDNEQTTQARGKAVSTLHSRVIESMAARPGGVAKAQEYFAARKHEIDADSRTALEAKLTSLHSVEQAQEFADKLTADGVSEADGLKMIRESLSGEAEKVAVAEWKTRNAEAEQTRERAQRQARDAAWDVYVEGGGIGAIKAAGLWDRLDGKDREAFIKRTEEAADRAASRADRAAARADRAEARAYRDETREYQRAERERIAAERERNSPEAVRRRGLQAVIAEDRVITLMHEDPEAFARLPLLQETDIPVPRVAALREQQRKILNGEAVDLELKVINNEVSAAVKSLDLKTPKARTEASAQFRAQYEEEIELFKAAHGKGPSKAERQEIQKQLLQRGVIDGWFGDTPARRFQARAREKTFIPNAPIGDPTGPNTVPPVTGAAPARGPAQRTVVRRGTNKQGQRVVQYSDGTIETEK